MTQPIKEELEAVLAANLIIRENLPEFSLFGDDNWKKIDRQNRTLQKAIDGEYIELDYDEEDSDFFACVQWCVGGDKSSDFGSSTLEEAKRFKNE